MHFETHHIKTPLNQHIESIFHFRDFMPDHRIEKVVPSGHLFLIFELDGIERNTFDEDLKPNGFFSKAWISGMHHKHLTISAHENSEMLVVQFKASGAFPFVQVPLYTLNDKVVPAELIFGPEIIRLRDELVLKPHSAEKFCLIEYWLESKFDANKIAPLPLEHLILSFQEQPFSKHSQLIQNYPYSNKHLAAQFKRYCGLTPKLLHRVFRFSALLSLIHQKQEINWADIAYETGYADQSHFIKEFQNFSGFNPSEYIRKGFNQSAPNFFPLD